MEVFLCIIFSVFAVYGIYSALRELVEFLQRHTCSGDGISREDAPPGCLGCGCCFWEERSQEDCSQDESSQEDCSQEEGPEGEASAEDSFD